jgi:transcriptional regulator with XRE-family HTH domain
MVTVDSIQARQSIAARGLLGWTQSDLSEKSGISISAVKNYERGVTNSVGTTAALRLAFEAHGIRFIIDSHAGMNDIGVILREKD